MSDKQMVLRVQMGTTIDEVEIGVTEREWDKLSDKEQGELIREWLPNVCEICVIQRED